MSSEHVHLKVHKELYENQLLLIQAINAITRIINDSEISFKSVNEKREFENNKNKLKRTLHKLNKIN